MFHHVMTGLGAYQHYKLDSHSNKSMAIGVWGNLWLVVTGVGTLMLLGSAVGERGVEDVAKKGRKGL